MDDAFPITEGPVDDERSEMEYGFDREENGLGLDSGADSMGEGEGENEENGEDEEDEEDEEDVEHGEDEMDSVDSMIAGPDADPLILLKALSSINQWLRI